MTNFLQVVSFDPLLLESPVAGPAGSTGSTGATGATGSIGTTGATGPAYVPSGSVLAYGAVTDGSVDTVAAFNAAVASLPAVTDVPNPPTGGGQGGGTITFPPGVYRIDSPLVLPSRTRLVGYGATLLAGPGFTGQAMVSFTPPAGVFAPDHVAVEGFTLDGATVAPEGLATGLAVYSAFRDLFIQKCGRGVTAYGGQYLYFSNVMSRGNSIVGMELDAYPRNQTVTVNDANPWTLTYKGQTTSSLATGSTAAQVQAALVALSTIGAGAAVVTGAAGGPYAVALSVGAIANPMTASANVTVVISTASAPLVDNNTFVRCCFQSNPINLRISNSASQEFYGCDFQNTTDQAGGTGTGIDLISGTGNQFNSCYFENNGTDINIHAGPLSTMIVKPYFSANAGFPLQRWIRNSGTGTSLHGTSGVNATPPVFNGTSAPFEQNSAAGDLTVFGFWPISGLPSMFCNEAGTDTNPNTGLVTSRLNVISKDARQNITSWYAKQTLIAATNVAVEGARLTADTGDRMTVSGQGDLSWGLGDGTFDTVLKRNAAAQFGVTGTVRPMTDATYNLGANGTSWLNTYTRSLIQPPVAQTLAAPGAVTINTPTTGYAEITLQANATSSVISGGQVNGAVLTITWIQDATGGRTYVWPTNCKFAGGVAPSDTTLSKRTSVTFHYDSTSTNWTELSRAVAVG